MIGGEQPKILANVNEEGNLVITDEFVELFYKEQEMNWKLVRTNDNLTKKSRAIIWIEWNEDGTFKEQFDSIAVGRSLIMSPFNQAFTWQTTSVTEIIENSADHIKFKTKNSDYELWKIKND
jgi:hypothetical protein